MLIVGISGGLNWDSSEYFPESSWFLHDAAAVIVNDGRIIAALEEERVNRLKHSNKFPIGAIRYCLEEAGVSTQDVDKWVHCFGDALRGVAWKAFMRDLGCDVNPTTTSVLADRLSKGLGKPVPSSRITTVDHHVAHVASAFEPSGFDSALVVTYDGGGNDGHGRIVNVVDRKYDFLATLTHKQSLGLFYHYAMRPIGYGRFEEYKVMGLAPYGDPARFRSAVSSLYSLGEKGDYEIRFDRLSTLGDVVKIRTPGEPFSQDHKDLAASIQEALERIAFHVIAAAQQETRQRNLCLAGGVALNCTFNGRLASTGQFDDIFVQPVATDAGAALGAALYVEKNENNKRPPSLKHVYFGRPIQFSCIEPKLRKWTDILNFERRTDICQEAAKQLSNGCVIGWVQGRSEFGPRALGNRSILADPRFSESKDRVNIVIKNREAYRPFAPSILSEYADEYYDIPDYPQRFAFMNFAVRVKEDKRSMLPATTHVDGTSRVQVVYKDTNPRYWTLISEFNKLTGVPVVLNTSFNDNAEPIVDSIDDALQCFLTTHLDLLVIDDYLIARKDKTIAVQQSLVISQPRTTQIIRQVHETDATAGYSHFLRTTVTDSGLIGVSAGAFSLIEKSDGVKSIEDILGEEPLSKELGDELLKLWRQRLIRLEPGSS
jgi:carbamoyltransferase